MSKGAFIQLMTPSEDVESSYLTRNPDITFFNALFRRHISFSSEEKEIIIPSLKNNTKNISIVLPKLGDFLSKIYLIVHLPIIYNKYKKWTHKQMHDYLYKYGIEYTYTSPDDSYLTDDDFIKIVGILTYDKINDKWVREESGLISDYINLLQYKKKLYESIIDVIKSINTSQFNDLDSYKIELYKKLFDLYKNNNYLKDSDKYLTPIIDYFWSYINDEHSISSFDIPNDIMTIHKFINVLDHDVEDNLNYIISSDTTQINQDTDINIYDSKTSWITDHIIQCNNNELSYVEPYEGMVVKINNALENMPINFLKDYCNIDNHSSGFGMFIDNKILNSFKIITYFNDDISNIDYSLGRYSMFPYYLPYDIGSNKLIRRKFDIINNKQTNIINHRYQVTTTPEIRTNRNNSYIVIVNISVTDILNNQELYTESYTFDNDIDVKNRFYTYTINGYTESDTISFDIFSITGTKDVIEDNFNGYVLSELQIYELITSSRTKQTIDDGFYTILYDNNTYIFIPYQLNNTFYYFNRDDLNIIKSNNTITDLQIKNIYYVFNNTLNIVDISSINGCILTYDMKPELSNEEYGYPMFINYNIKNIDTNINETFYIFYVDNNTIKSINNYTRQKTTFYVYLYSNTSVNINSQYGNNKFYPNSDILPYRNVNYNGIYTLVLETTQPLKYTISYYDIDDGTYIFEYLNTSNDIITLNMSVFISINKNIINIDKSILLDDIILFNESPYTDTSKYIYNDNNKLTIYDKDNEYLLFYVVNKYSKYNLQLFYIKDNAWSKFNLIDQYISYDGKTWRLNVNNTCQYFDGVFKNFVISKTDYINTQALSYIQTPICGVINNNTYGILTDTIDLFIKDKYDYLLQYDMNMYVPTYCDIYANGAIVSQDIISYVQNLCIDSGYYNDINTDFTGLVVDYIVDDIANIVITSPIENYGNKYVICINDIQYDCSVYYDIPHALYKCENHKIISSDYPTTSSNILILNDASITDSDNPGNNTDQPYIYIRQPNFLCTNREVIDDHPKILFDKNKIYTVLVKNLSNKDKIICYRIDNSEGLHRISKLEITNLPHINDNMSKLPVIINSNSPYQHKNIYNLNIINDVLEFTSLYKEYDSYIKDSDDTNHAVIFSEYNNIHSQLIENEMYDFIYDHDDEQITITNLPNTIYEIKITGVKQYIYNKYNKNAAGHYIIETSTQHVITSNGYYAWYALLDFDVLNDIVIDIKPSSKLLILYMHDNNIKFNIQYYSKNFKFLFDNLNVSDDQFKMISQYGYKKFNNTWETINALDSYFDMNSILTLKNTEAYYVSNKTIKAIEQTIYKYRIILSYDILSSTSININQTLNFNYYMYNTDNDIYDYMYDILNVTIINDKMTENQYTYTSNNTWAISNNSKLINSIDLHITNDIYHLTKTLSQSVNNNYNVYDISTQVNGFIEYRIDRYQISNKYNPTILKFNSYFIVYSGLTNDNTISTSQYHYLLNNNNIVEYTTNIELLNRYNAVALSNNNYVIIAGGTDMTNSLDTIELFNYTTYNTIEKINVSEKLLYPRNNFTGVVCGDYFVFAGGVNDSATNKIDVFYIENNTLKRKDVQHEFTNTTRSELLSFALTDTKTYNFICFIGGITNDKKTNNEICIYDIDNGSQYDYSLNTGGCYDTSSIVIYNKSLSSEIILLIAGGFDNNNNITNIIQCLKIQLIDNVINISHLTNYTLPEYLYGMDIYHNNNDNILIYYNGNTTTETEQKSHYSFNYIYDSNPFELTQINAIINDSLNRINSTSITFNNYIINCGGKRNDEDINDITIYYNILIQELNNIMSNNNFTFDDVPGNYYSAISIKDNITKNDYIISSCGDNNVSPGDLYCYTLQQNDIQEIELHQTIEKNISNIGYKSSFVINNHQDNTSCLLCGGYTNNNVNDTVEKYYIENGKIINDEVYLPNGSKSNSASVIYRNINNHDYAYIVHITNVETDYPIEAYKIDNNKLVLHNSLKLKYPRYQHISTIIRAVIDGVDYSYILIIGGALINSPGGLGTDYTEVLTINSDGDVINLSLDNNYKNNIINSPFFKLYNKISVDFGVSTNGKYAIVAGGLYRDTNISEATDKINIYTIAEDDGIMIYMYNNDYSISRMYLCYRNKRLSDIYNNINLPNTTLTIENIKYNIIYTTAERDIQFDTRFNDMEPIENNTYVCKFSKGDPVLLPYVYNGPDEQGNDMYTFEYIDNFGDRHDATSHQPSTKIHLNNPMGAMSCFITDKVFYFIGGFSLTTTFYNTREGYVNRINYRMDDYGDYLFLFPFTFSGIDTLPTLINRSISSVMYLNNNGNDIYTVLNTGGYSGRYLDNSYVYTWESQPYNEIPEFTTRDDLKSYSCENQNAETIGDSFDGTYIRPGNVTVIFGGSGNRQYYNNINIYNAYIQSNKVDIMKVDNTYLSLTYKKRVTAHGVIKNGNNYYLILFGGEIPGTDGSNNIEMFIFSDNILSYNGLRGNHTDINKEPIIKCNSLNLINPVYSPCTGYINTPNNQSSYSIIAGGYNNSSVLDTVNVFYYDTTYNQIAQYRQHKNDTNVGRFGNLDLVVPRVYMASATITYKNYSYCLFAGGATSIQQPPNITTVFDIIDIYSLSEDNELEKINNGSIILSQPRANLVGIGIGKYAIFAGGYTNYENTMIYSDVIDIFYINENGNIVRYNHNLKLNYTCSNLSVTTLNNYILFAGGQLIDQNNIISINSITTLQIVEDSIISLDMPIQLYTNGYNLYGFNITCLGIEDQQYAVFTNSVRDDNNINHVYDVFTIKMQDISSYCCIYTINNVSKYSGYMYYTIYNNQYLLPIYNNFRFINNDSIYKIIYDENINNDKIVVNDNYYLSYIIDGVPSVSCNDIIYSSDYNNLNVYLCDHVCIYTIYNVDNIDQKDTNKQIVYYNNRLYHLIPDKNDIPTIMSLNMNISTLHDCYTKLPNYIQYSESYYKFDKRINNYIRTLNKPSIYYTLDKLPIGLDLNNNIFKYGSSYYIWLNNKFNLIELTDDSFGNYYDITNLLFEYTSDIVCLYVDDINYIYKFTLANNTLSKTFLNYTTDNITYYYNNQYYNNTKASDIDQISILYDRDTKYFYMYNFMLPCVIISKLSNTLKYIDINNNNILDLNIFSNTRLYTKINNQYNLSLDIFNYDIDNVMYKLLYNSKSYILSYNTLINLLYIIVQNDNKIYRLITPEEICDITDELIGFNFINISSAALESQTQYISVSNLFNNYLLTAIKETMILHAYYKQIITISPTTTTYDNMIPDYYYGMMSNNILKLYSLQNNILVIDTIISIPYYIYNSKNTSNHWAYNNNRYYSVQYNSSSKYLIYTNTNVLNNINEVITDITNEIINNMYYYISTPYDNAGNNFVYFVKSDKIYIYKYSLSNFKILDISDNTIISNNSTSELEKNKNLLYIINNNNVLYTDYLLALYILDDGTHKYFDIIEPKKSLTYFVYDGNLNINIPQLIYQDTFKIYVYEDSWKLYVEYDQNYKHMYIDYLYNFWFDNDNNIYLYIFDPKTYQDTQTYGMIKLEDYYYINEIYEDQLQYFYELYKYTNDKWVKDTDKILYTEIQSFISTYKHQYTITDYIYTNRSDIQIRSMCIDINDNIYIGTTDSIYIMTINNSGQVNINSITSQNYNLSNCITITKGMYNETTTNQYIYFGFYYTSYFMIGKNDNNNVTLYPVYYTNPFIPYYCNIIISCNHNIYIGLNSNFIIKYEESTTLTPTDGNLTQIFYPDKKQRNCTAMSNDIYNNIYLGFDNANYILIYTNTNEFITYSFDSDINLSCTFMITNLNNDTIITFKDCDYFMIFNYDNKSLSTINYPDKRSCTNLICSIDNKIYFAFNNTPVTGIYDSYTTTYSEISINDNINIVSTISKYGDIYLSNFNQTYITKYEPSYDIITSTLPEYLICSSIINIDNILYLLFNNSNYIIKYTPLTLEYYPYKSDSIEYLTPGLNNNCTCAYYLNSNDIKKIIIGYGNYNKFGVYDISNNTYNEYIYTNSDVSCSCISSLKTSENQMILIFGLSTSNYIIKYSVNINDNGISFDDIKYITISSSGPINCTCITPNIKSNTFYLGFDDTNYLIEYFPTGSMNVYTPHVYSTNIKKCNAIIYNTNNDNIYIGYKNSSVFGIYNVQTNIYTEKTYTTTKSCSELLFINNELYFGFTDYNSIGIYDITTDLYTEKEYVTTFNKNVSAMCGYNGKIYITYNNSDPAILYIQKGKYRNNSWYIDNFSNNLYNISRNKLVDNIQKITPYDNLKFVISYKQNNTKQNKKITYNNYEWTISELDNDKIYYYDYESAYKYQAYIIDGDNNTIVDASNNYKLYDMSTNNIINVSSGLIDDLSIPEIISYNQNDTIIIYSTGTYNDINDIIIKYRYDTTGWVYTDLNNNNLIIDDINLVKQTNNNTTTSSTKSTVETLTEEITTTIKKETSTSTKILYYIKDTMYYYLTINNITENINEIKKVYNKNTGETTTTSTQQINKYNTYSISDLIQPKDYFDSFIDITDKIYYYYSYGELNSRPYNNGETYLLSETIDGKYYKYITKDETYNPIIPDELIEITNHSGNYFNKTNNKIYTFIDSSIVQNDDTFSILLLDNNIVTKIGNKYNTYIPSYGDGIVLNNNNKYEYYSFDGTEWKNHIYIYNITKFITRIKHYIIKQIATDSNCRFLLFKYINLFNVNDNIGKLTYEQYFNMMLNDYMSENTNKEKISDGYLLIDNLTYIYNNCYTNITDNNYSIKDYISSYDDVNSMKNKIYSEVYNVITTDFIFNIYLFKDIINNLVLKLSNNSLLNNNVFVFDYYGIGGNSTEISPTYFNINDHVVSYTYNDNEKYIYDNFIVPLNNISSYINYDNELIYGNTDLLHSFKDALNTFKSNILTNYKKLYDNGISPFIKMINDHYCTNSAPFTQDNFYNNTAFNNINNDTYNNYYSYRSIKEFFDYIKYNDNGELINDHMFINIINILNRLTNNLYSGGQVSNIYEFINGVNYTIHNSIQSMINNDFDVLFANISVSNKNNIQKYIKLINSYVINILNNNSNDILKYDISYSDNNEFLNVINNLYKCSHEYFSDYYTDTLIHVYAYIIKVKLYDINYISPDSTITTYDLTNDIHITGLNPIEFTVLSYYYNLEQYIYNNIPDLKEYIPKIKLICESYLKSSALNNGMSYLINNKESIPELFNGGNLYKNHRTLDVFSSWVDYLLNMIKDEYNNLFNTIFSDEIIDKLYNPFKECKDYICDNIFNDTEILDFNLINDIDFYYNMDKFDNYTISFCNIILDKTIDNYKKILKYSDILNTLNTFILQNNTNTYTESINLLIDFHTYIYKLCIGETSFLNIDTFRNLLQNADASDIDTQGLSYLNDQDVLMYGYRKLWADVLDNINKRLSFSSDDVSLMNIYYNNKYISCFDILIKNHIDPLTNINTNPYNNISQQLLYTWYVKYIINDIYINEYNYRSTTGISKIDISAIMYLRDIINGNVTINENEQHLLEWYNNEDYKDEDKTKWLEQINNLYGIYYKTSQEQNLTPLILYSTYQNIINSRFNFFETEMDFIKFLIWYIVKQSDFSDILDINGDNIDQYANNIINMYEDKIQNIINILDFIGVKNEYDQDDYSDLEEYIRILMNNQYNDYISCKWVNNVGYKLIKSIDIILGDQLIETINGEFMEILYNTAYDINSHKLNKLIGCYSDSNIIKSTELIIPIPFTISKYISAALPLICLQHSEIKINIQYNDIKSLIDYNKLGDLHIKWNNSQDYLLVKYLYIKHDYRLQYAVEKHDILLEQLQYYDDIILDINSQLDYTIPLNFSNCSKELFIKFQMFSKIDYDMIQFNKSELDFYDISLRDEIKDSIYLSDNKYLFLEKIIIEEIDIMDNPDIDIFNKINNLKQQEIKIIDTYELPKIYDNIIGNVKRKCKRKYLITKSFIPFITEIEIKFSGRIRERIHGERFYSLLKKYECHTQNNYDGIYVYPFSLKPELFQPSGECNFSRTGQLEIRCLFNDKIPKIINTESQINVRMSIYNISYNLLRIVSGMGGLIF